MEADKPELFPIKLHARAYRFFPKSKPTFIKERNKRVPLRKKELGFSFMDRSNMMNMNSGNCANSMNTL